MPWGAPSGVLLPMPQDAQTMTFAVVPPALVAADRTPEQRQQRLAQMIQQEHAEPMLVPPADGINTPAMEML